MPDPLPLPVLLPGLGFEHDLPVLKEEEDDVGVAEHEITELLALTQLGAGVVVVSGGEGATLCQRKTQGV